MKLARDEVRGEAVKKCVQHLSCLQQLKKLYIADLTLAWPRRGPVLLELRDDDIVENIYT